MMEPLLSIARDAATSVFFFAASAGQRLWHRAMLYMSATMVKAARWLSFSKYFLESICDVGAYIHGFASS